MKGIVFTEFMDMVEDKFGLDVADRILQEAAPASGGAYTAVATYDFRELVALVTALSQATRTPPPDLVRAFGRHLFGRFVAAFPMFFPPGQTVFEFLGTIENHIHVEVLKLYPDAELPRFECTPRGADGMEMIYHSNRPLADFAEGLIQGCAEHFHEPLRIDRQALPAEQGQRVRFTLNRGQERAA
jgi:hypothetical protein